MTILKYSIVLEGPNGSGKSTLAKQLSEKYGVPIIHSTKPTDAFEAIEESFRQHHAAVSPKIFDRSHAISRLVYQKGILGNLEKELLYVMAKHIAQYTNLIYCTGNGERNTDKPHYDEQLIKETTDNQEAIVKGYKNIFYTLNGLKHQKYNFEKDDISCLQLI